MRFTGLYVFYSTIYMLWYKQIIQIMNDAHIYTYIGIIILIFAFGFRLK